MENIKKYMYLKEQILEHELEIKKILENEEVKRYIELEAKIKKDKEDLEKLHLQIETQKMENCLHVFVIISKGKGEHHSYTRECYYCIKCGLDTRYDKHGSIETNLTELQKRMYDIFCLTARNSVLINSLCDLTLAKKIYEGIKKNNPNISDNDLVHYFKVANYNIENKHEKKHIKHLGLHPTYKKGI